MAILDQRRETMVLWALLLGNFVIGTGVLLPSGLLSILSASLNETPATTSLLIFAGGLVVGFGAPVLASLSNRFDRRKLLLSALTIFAVGHILCAIVPNFWSLLLIRTLTMVGAAVFTPQAAATVSLLVPQEKRAQAITFIFIGWAIASVMGIPLGNLLATQTGWRATFFAVAILASVAGLAVAKTMPQGLIGQPLDLSSWTRVGKSPALLCILAVTLLSLSGHFAVLGFLTPILNDVFAVSPATMAVVLAVFGAAGVVGNYAATRFIGKLGPDRTVLIGLVISTIGLIIFALSFGNLWFAVFAIALWGLGFATNSSQQGRLVAAAPALASATVALNSSAVYLGQSIGAAAGGKLISQGHLAAIVWTSVVFLGLAIAASLLAQNVRR